MGGSLELFLKSLRAASASGLRGRERKNGATKRKKREGRGRGSEQHERSQGPG